jgi:hypothetical protein
MYEDEERRIDIRYPSHGRSRLIHLFPASESTEVSDAVDTYYRIENTAVET